MFDSTISTTTQPITIYEITTLFLSVRSATLVKVSESRSSRLTDVGQFVVCSDSCLSVGHIRQLVGRLAVISPQQPESRHYSFTLYRISNSLELDAF